MGKTKGSPVRWGIAKLKDHPRQAELFGDIADQELEALAEDMRKNGQRFPVEILPDGTVLAGHQRIRAARLLGWSEVEVVVRADLQEAGPAAAEMLLINDNLLRRQLSPLGKARCISRLMELGGAGGKEEIKAAIASQLQMSPRTVNRYLLVLRTPPAVQNAFDRGVLPLVTAGQVAGLDPSSQKLIAKQIQRGEKAMPVLRQHLAADQASRGHPQALPRLVKVLKAVLPAIELGLELPPCPRSRLVLQLIGRAHATFGQILQAHGAAGKDRPNQRWG